jgi:hypothetical protein
MAAHSHPGQRRRPFLARAMVITTLAAAALFVGAPSASARPNCATLSKAISQMTKAAENARQAGNLSVANYRAETALYYASLSQEYGCL